MATRPGAIAIMVKTPGLSAVKTRLAESIGKDNAEHFYRLSCSCIGGVAKDAARRAVDVPMVPYWAVAEPLGLKNSLWSEFERIEQGEGQLGTKMSKVYDELHAKHPFVIILGFDVPHLTPDVLVEVGRSASSFERFILGPNEDGGFYLFAGNKPIPRNIWESVPYADWETADVLEKKLTPIAPVKRSQINFEVDSREDLTRLRKLFGSRKDLLPAQKTMLNWLNENSF